MIPLAKIKDNKELVIDRMKKRGLDLKQEVNQLLELDQQRGQAQKERDDALAESKKLSKEIGAYYKSGETEKAESIKAQSSELKEKSKQLAQKVTEIEEQIRALQVNLPNIPVGSVPQGDSDQENELMRQGSMQPKANANAKPHWELTDHLGLVNFEAGNKITGAGFPVYTRQGAQLQRAMINFFLDHAAEEGYQEFEPPILVNEATGFATGQLPDKEGQMYHIPNEDLYLIPTAEVPLTNFYRDTILKPDDFPIKLTAYTPCFRREAGSYGKEVRGLNRLHQFDKVEIVQIQHPDKSYDTLEAMVAYVEQLVQKLELPYRVMKLCGGDLGAAATLTYDIEVYSPAQDKWLEVSSISNFEDYQSNRLKLRFKDEDKKTKLAHTLNGSALAFPRLLAAMLENYQSEDGTAVKIPEALAKYTGFEEIRR